MDETPPVRISAFLLADHAEAVGGKLFVNGAGWDTITVASLPTQHPHLSVAVIVHVPWNQIDEEHSLEVQLRDEDGQDVLPQTMGSTFSAGRTPHMRPGDETTVTLVFNMIGIPITRVGHFEFVCYIDGAAESYVGFRVIEQDQASA